MADSAALVASEVGGLKITPHPARKKRDRPMTSGVHCVATGPLLEGGQAGVASVLSVHTRDANGQRRTSGGDVVTVTLLPHDGKLLVKLLHARGVPFRAQGPPGWRAAAVLLVPFAYLGACGCVHTTQQPRSPAGTA